MNAAELTPELTALVGVARGLTPEQVRQVTNYAEELGKQPAVPPVDSSTEWSEEDMRDFALGTLRHFEAQHPDDEWGWDDKTPRDGSDGTRTTRMKPRG